MKKLILVIEDSDIIRSTICQLLYSKKFKVMSARDGCLGFLLAKEFQPDLIICDLNLPKLDGYEVLKKLRSNLPTAKIPFIFLSSEIDRASRRRTLQLGANGYLMGPVDKSKLLEAITNQFKLLKSPNRSSLTEDRLNYCH